MATKQEREYHFIVVFNSRTGKWEIDIDGEEHCFNNGSIYNVTTGEWEYGYAGDGEYVEGELETMEKFQKALDQLNEKGK